jgi:hypothetical protein
VPQDVAGVPIPRLPGTGIDFADALDYRPAEIEAPVHFNSNGTFVHPMEFDSWGRLVPSVVSGAASSAMPADKACLPDHNGTVIVNLNSYPHHVSILRLGYLAGSRGQLLLKFDGQTLLCNFSRDLKAAFLPLLGSGATLEIDTLTGKLPCIGDVKVGFLLPSGAGPAIPAMAVNG